MQFDNVIDISMLLPGKRRPVNSIQINLWGVCWLMNPDDFNTVTCWVSTPEEAEEIASKASDMRLMFRIEKHGDEDIPLYSVHLATEEWVGHYYDSGGLWAYR